MKVFDAGKTRIIELLYGEKNYDNMSSHFHLIPERHGQKRTEGRTDRQTDAIAISISRVSVLTGDKNFTAFFAFVGLLYTIFQQPILTLSLVG